MQELEDEIDRNKQQQGKNANFKFCIAAASGKPNKVGMHPATLGKPRFLSIHFFLLVFQIQFFTLFPSPLYCTALHALRKVLQI